MSAEMSLPEGWIKTDLGSVAQWGSGGTPSRNNSEYYGGTIPWVKTGDLGPKIIKTVDEYITEEAVKNSSAKFFPKNSVAIAMYGATIGKTSILGIDATTNQACAVAIPQSEITSTAFLYYLLRSEKDNFIAKGKGGAQPNISQSLIKEHEISIPPLAEQHQIAQRLDELLAQVDTIKARLDAIPNILKRFRQSVLSAAVSGKLTEEWRSLCGVSTDEWIKSCIGNLARVSTGKTPKRTEMKYWSEGNIPWLTSACTGTSYTEQAKQFVTELAVKKCGLKMFEPGTLLLAMYGEGKTRGQISELRIKATCNQACATITVDEISSIRSFIKLCLLENYEKTREVAVGGAQPNLNLEKVREIPIHLPPKNEQIEIVRRVDHLFTFADQIEQRVNDAKTRVDKLTQSILAKAFRGELTADWRTEHPELISGENSAEALLAKIQAAKAALDGKKKKGKAA